METTLKQQALMKITALPDGADFRENLKALQALRPKPSRRRTPRKTRPRQKAVSCLDLAKPVIGALAGPTDLSINKAYFEELGE